MIPSVIRRALQFSILVALGGLSACTYWHGDLERLTDQTDRDFRRDPTKSYAKVSLQTVVNNPTAYLFLPVQFTAVINRVGERTFVPYWTTFLPENFIGFSAWDSASDLTQAEVRVRSHPLFFLHKLNPSARDLAGAGRFTLVRIEGMVVGDFDQKAWFEARRVEILDSDVYTEAALADLGLAREALAGKKNAQAIRHFEDALGGVWVPSVRYDIRMNLARLHEAAGNLQAAFDNYQDAYYLDLDSQEAIEGMARTKAAIKAAAAAQP